MDPDWSGTDLTPVLVLRVLKTFANLGIGSAALCAAPIAEDLIPSERDRIATKIASMWSRVGFVPIRTANLDGYDNIVMAATFDYASLSGLLDALVGTDPVLRAAADLA